MGKILVIRIKEAGAYAHGRGSYDYKNEINLEDFRKLALVLLDLESHNGNVERAFREFKKMKEEGFPW